MTPDKYERFRKRIVLLAWAYFIFMAFMLLHPRPPMPRLPFQLMIKTTHLCAFGVFACLIGLARSRWSLGVWTALAILWSAGSECLQIFTGRYFEWFDIVQNLCGCALGLTLSTWARRRLTRCGREKNEDRNDG